MTKVLTTQNAEITTASVQISTLTISGKQVTLAVFRQLREELLIAEDGTLNGIPWGTVNYHPDKCGADPEHWHVVWQRGSELLRSRVRPKPGFDLDPYDFWTDTADEFYTACVRDQLKGESRYFGGSPISKEKTGYGSDRVRREIKGHHRGIRVAWDMSKEAFEAASITEDLPTLRASAAREWEQYPDPSQPYQGHARKSLVEKESRLSELMTLLEEERTPIDDLFRAFDEEVQAEAERRRRHRDLRESIAALPQLFIAV